MGFVGVAGFLYVLKAALLLELREVGRVTRDPFLRSRVLLSYSCLAKA